MEEEQIQILKFSFNNLYLPATYFQNCINKTVYTTFEYFGLFGKKVWVLKRSTICFVYTIFKVNGRYKLFERTFLASEKMYCERMFLTT